MDDFDLFKERMLGSGDKKPSPHKRALLFVDNSGADIVLGMLPLARELLRRGTEVNLSYLVENEAFMLKMIVKLLPQFRNLIIIKDGICDLV